MHKASNSERLRSPDGLKSSVFKAIRNARTIAGNDSKNIRCPFATIDDELEIADFRILDKSEMNEELKPMQKSQEKNHNESSRIFSSHEEPLLIDAILTVQWIQACSTGDLQTVGRLIKEKPYLISCAPTINHGFSGLHYAAKDGHSSVLRFLVLNGADVNLRTSGYTPLHLAAIGKQHEIISILLRDCGADASIEDYSGHTYQHYLTEQGNAYNRVKNENIIRSNKCEPQQNDASSNEGTQFPRLKSFRKAVHGRMRFFTDK
ncbi:Ankyrin repeat family protein [Acanthocheilonema viteae]